MAPLLVLVVVLVPAILGLGVARALTPGRRWPALEATGWAYPLGAMATAMIVGAWMISGLGPIRSLGIALPAAIGVVLLVWRRRPRPDLTPLDVAGSGEIRLERIIFRIVLSVVVLVFVDRIAVFDLNPVTRGDEAMMWTLRAKFLYADWVSGSPVPAGVAEARGVVQPHYPLLNPLLHVWVFLVSGGVTHVLNRIPPQVVLLSVVLASAAKLRSTLRPTVAALFLLLWLPGQSAEAIVLPAHADIFVACGFFLALEAWREFSRDGSAASWRLFASALALLVWSKHEGTVLALCTMVGCACHAVRDRVVRQSLRGLGRRLAWFALPAGILVVTWTVNAVAGHESDLIADNPGRQPLWERMISQFAERAWPGLRFIGNEIVLSMGTSRVLWIPFLIALIAIPGVAFAARRIQATVAILCAAIAYWLVFVGTYRDLEWQLGCAADRVFFHLWPALLLWTARLTADLFPRLRNGSTSPG